MQEQHCADWQEFQEAIRSIRAAYRMSDLAANIVRPSPLCFRGQSRAEWSLETTLERAGHRSISFRRYARLLATIYPEISTVTDRRFNVPSYQEFDDWLSNCQREAYLPIEPPPGYEFMVYLRQHGYPSPLLDWTDSEYIAAYFAFADAPQDDPTNCVAIYAYVERSGNFKASGAADPTIVSAGPFVRSHPRHFTQQARYTFCRQYDQEWKYVEHQLVFDGDAASLAGKQDILYKFTMPASERRDVMNELRRFNITAWTLFQTEESLMQAMAFKTMDQ
ncbi:MAG TPA: FRG domain-containing protein [Rhodanobacter sp.]|nr:FRG domain-containing protein [Rhodanobacter sp.]